MSGETVSGWRVATYTGGQGNCVEVGRSATMIAVRDTKNGQDGPMVWLTLAEWRAFMRRIKSLVLLSQLIRSPFGGIDSGRGFRLGCMNVSQ